MASQIVPSWRTRSDGKWHPSELCTAMEVDISVQLHHRRIASAISFHIRIDFVCYGTMCPCDNLNVQNDA